MVVGALCWMEARSEENGPGSECLEVCWAQWVFENMNGESGLLGLLLERL